jgi:hypothetical protein
MKTRVQAEIVEIDYRDVFRSVYVSNPFAIGIDDFMDVCGE